MRAQAEAPTSWAVGCVEESTGDERLVDPPGRTDVSGESERCVLCSLMDEISYLLFSLNDYLQNEVSSFRPPPCTLGV